MHARTVSLVLAVTFLLGSTSPAEAVELELTAVQYPDRNVSLEFTSRGPHPVAALSGRASWRDGLAEIDISYERMKPAVVFGGQVTSYIVWAIYRDGMVVNLGDLDVTERPSGRESFTAPANHFALIVTAEAHPLVATPSELVIAVARPGNLRGGSSSTFAFADFAPAPERDHDNITAVRYEVEVPVELVQARRIMKLAEQLGAKEHATELMQEAERTLWRANTYAGVRGGSRAPVVESSRETISLGSQAVRLTERRLEALALEEQIAERRAEMAALEERLTGAERELTSARLARESLERETLRLGEEKADLELAMVDLRQEREQLAQRLEGALSQVAETRQSARGLILNLPDILFAFDSAELKPESRITLAKLAGILHIMPELNLRVEGHTDSVGSPSYNLRLSQRRADSVFDFLAEQGIAAARMTTAGYGVDRPIASNDTEQGRARNRRVEIVIAEGVIAEE